MTAIPAPFLAVVLEHSREAIFVCDRGGGLRWASPRAEELVGPRPLDAVHPRDRRLLAAACRRLAATPGAHRLVTCRIGDGAGGWRLVEWDLANRLDDPQLGGGLRS